MIVRGPTDIKRCMDPHIAFYGCFDSMFSNNSHSLQFLFIKNILSMKVCLNDSKIVKQGPKDVVNRKWEFQALLTQW